MHAEYPGSPRLWLPGYITLNSQSLMHGVGRRFLRLGFWSRLWGSVTVSLLFGDKSFYIKHILMHAVYPGSPCLWLPGYITLDNQSLMHGVGRRFL